MGDEPIKWADTSIGKIVDSQVLEIKDFEYVVAILTNLKGQAYNESILNYTRLPYAFVIAASEGLDEEDDYVLVYFLKFTQEMLDAYMNPSLMLFMNGFHFRIYRNGELLTSYTKTASSPGDKG